MLNFCLGCSSSLMVSVLLLFLNESVFFVSRNFMLLQVKSVSAHYEHCVIVTILLKCNRCKNKTKQNKDKITINGGVLFLFSLCLIVDMIDELLSQTIPHFHYLQHKDFLVNSVGPGNGAIWDT